jgi:hypothetical protein
VSIRSDWIELPGDGGPAVGPRENALDTPIASWIDVGAEYESRLGTPDGPIRADAPYSAESSAARPHRRPATTVVPEEDRPPAIATSST